MIKYLFIFFASLVLIFLDHLFFGTLGILISPIVALVLFDILTIDVFFVFILFSTLSLDVTFHYSLGLSLFSTGISLGVFRVFNQLVHSDNFLVKLLPVFLYNVSLYVIINIMQYLPNISLMFN
ncbi:MAG TPA: hypothetical protein VHA74_00765, partial [Candidatus Dojkabacteria bacterium]|nr:hypothetical protein [Candidatus Dojkabacteria bacterium]